MSEEFEKVAAILRWKRHEQPPPGYFVGFSRQVIARLESEQAIQPIAWWERMLASFDAKAVMVGTYSVAVCGSLLYGMSLLRGANEDGQDFLKAGGWGDPLAASTAFHSGQSFPSFSQATATFPLGNGQASPIDLPNANALFDGSLLKVQRARSDGLILKW